MVAIAWQSKLFQIYSKWLIWSFSGLDRHLKGDMSPIKSWKGHGVACEMHQNAPKMVTIALQHIEMTNFSSIVWVSTLVHFGGFWCFFAHLMCDPTTPCTESYSLLSVQEIKKEIILVSQDKFETCNGDQLTILVHFGPFWRILVHLMCDPKTPQWLDLTHIPFQVSHLCRKRLY